MLSVGAIALELELKDRISEQIESAAGAAAMAAKRVIGGSVGAAVGSIKLPEISLPEISVQQADVPEIDTPVIKAPELPDIGGEHTLPVTVPEPDISAAKAQIDRLSEYIISRLSGIRLTLDTSSAAEEAEKLVQQLGLIQKKWQEVQHGAADGADISDPAEPLRAGITLDTSQAERQIDSLAEYAEKKLNNIEFSVSNPEMPETDTPETSVPEIPDMPEPEVPDTSKIADIAVKSALTVYTAYEKIRAAATKTFTAIKKLGSKAFSGLKKLGGKALDSLKAKFTELRKSTLSVSAPLKKLGISLKNTFKSVFLMAGAYAAFRTLKDGLLEAAKADEKFSESLNAVKANLNIAFTPIIRSIMPLLNTLMSGLAAATKKVAAFTASLFGMTYAQAAEATKQLKNVAKEAKKAKLSAAGIDELNILSDSSENADDTADSGIDYDSLDLSEPELPDWAERLKSSIRSGDWGGVGQILAERVNSVFQGIDWDGIEARAAAVAGKVADGINGFFLTLDHPALGEAAAGGINTVTSVINRLSDDIDFEGISRRITGGLNTAVRKIKWSQLGRALSAKIRILTDILYGFVTEFHWAELGTGIGDAVNGWFDGIDFAKLGVTLSEGVKGVFDTLNAMLDRIDFRSIGSKFAEFVNNIDIPGILSRLAGNISRIVSSLLDIAIGFFENVDWHKLGDELFESIKRVIEAIDWSGLVSRAFELLGAVIGAGAALADSLFKNIKTLLHNAWERVKDYFKEKIEEKGGNVVSGICKGILDALKNIGKWLYDNVYKPFMNGLDKAFGITSSSPSKETAKVGGSLIEGMENAVKNGISKVTEKFEEMLSKIKQVFENIPDWFGEKFGKAWDRITEKFSDIGTWFGDRKDDIKEKFSGIKDDIGGWFSSAWSKVTEKFSAIGEWFGDRKKDISDNIANIKDSFREWFSGAWENVKSIFSGENVSRFFGGVLSNIRTVFATVKEWFREKFEGAYSAVTDAFSGISEFFSGKWQSIKSGAVDSLNAIIGKVEEAVNIPMQELMKLAAPVLRMFGIDADSLKYIHIPQIPALAEGGYATAPTLAMIGDNRNAAVDPEVVSPLSKLKELKSGDNERIIEILSTILQLLRSGISAELTGLPENDLKRAIIRIIAEENSRRGS